MDPRWLLHLAEIADLGSFSRAAAVLHLTQPTLSRTIKQLEDRVGSPVLKRGRYGVTPTSIGQVLAQQGRAIRASIHQAQSGIDGWEAGSTQELRVGIGPMVALALLPRFIDEAFRCGWSSRLIFRTEGPVRLIECLQKGEIDVALAPAELYFKDDVLMQKHAFPDRVGIYAGKDHPLARKHKVEVAELADYDWLGIGSFSRFRGSTAEILETIGATGIRTKIEFSGNAASAVDLLRTGNWLGLIPHFLGSFLPGANDLVRLPVSRPLPTRDVGFCFRREMAEHPQLLRYCAMFTEFVSDLRAKAASPSKSFQQST